MQIDIFHDTVCPWCRIGKANLKAALADWEGEPVSVNYHAFFLNPDVPEGGTDFKQYLLAKGNGQIPLEQWFAAPQERGAAVGLTFNFEAIEVAPNTLLSHRVIALTPDEQKEAMIDAIYAAYFEHGQDIGDEAVLLQLAQAIGLDVDALRDQLSKGAMLEECRMEAEMARYNGIQGVPFFIINNALGFSGAHPPEKILMVLKQAAAETTP